jgi:hypothetical protein
MRCHAFWQEPPMDLSSIHRRSTRTLVFTAIFFWFFGGFYLADGIQRLVQDKLAYKWPGSFLICSAYLGVGIFYTVMLLRRIPSNSEPSHALSNNSIPSARNSDTQ